MDWNRGHVIGHGSSATVSIATSSNTGDCFAVKSAEISQSELLQREQRILSSLSSPYIVSYKGCDVTREKNRVFYNLFMEYMPFGTLLQTIHRHGGQIEEPAMACYTRQVLQGLEYLHSNGLVHCDIKGTNILIGEDGAKIADFGCAKRINELEETPAEPIRGTPMFMAPEVARGEEQGCPCDIWSLGCTVIEMATGISPWLNVVDPVSVLYRIAYSGDVPEIPVFLSEEAKDFLGKCLKRNPKERWTANQLLKHPFLGNAKQIQESNSSSPTGILDQGFWNSVEEPESLGNLIHTSFENSPSDRIRKLALISGEPSWTWNEGWITTRGNDEVEASSTEELERSNDSCRVSRFICEDCKCKEFSVRIGSSNFERCIDEMIFPAMSDFL